MFSTSTRNIAINSEACHAKVTFDEVELIFDTCICMIWKLVLPTVMS